LLYLLAREGVTLKMNGAKGSSSGPHIIASQAASGSKIGGLKTFFSQHWDKLLTHGLSIAIAGTVGFFTSISVVKGDIARISERVAVIETEIASHIKPKLMTIDQQCNQLRDLKADVDVLRRQNDIAIQTNLLVDLRLEQQQEKTLKTLEKILSQLPVGLSSTVLPKR
jgi:hypothetical protein